MRRITSWCAVVAVAGLVAFGARAIADEKDKAEKLSAGQAAQGGRRRRQGPIPGRQGHQRREGDRGRQGRLRHRADAGGVKYETDVHEDGTIVEIEKEIKDVPAVVAKAIEGKYPKAKVVEVMDVTR